jgi:hypothetical protein
LLKKVIRNIRRTGFSRHPENKLSLFPHHCNSFFRAFVCADTAALAEYEIDGKFPVNHGIRAVEDAQSAGIAFYLVNNGPEDPP